MGQHRRLPGVLQRRTSLHIRGWLIGSIVGLLSSATTLADAAKKADDVETEHLFGFVEGADIGKKGEREFMADTSGRFGKGLGTYSNVATSLEAKFTLLENFRVSAATVFAYYGIAGVTGLDDRRQASLAQISFGARYRVLDREKAPFGLTVSFEPHWGFVDGVSSASANRRGIEFLIAADRELVNGRVFGAFNVFYGPEQTRLRVSRETERDSAAGIGAAITARIMPGLFLGGEMRYLRHYEGLALNSFSGHAIYAGPTLYLKLGGDWWLSAAWNSQLRGTTAGSSGALDLTNFERHHAKLRFGTNF